MENNIIKEIKSDGVIIVKINIRYPVSGNDIIDRYILRIVNALERFAEKKLFMRALREKEETKNFVPLSLVATYKSVMKNENFFSFWFDVFVWESGSVRRVKRIPLNFDQRASSIIFPLEKYHRRELMGVLDVSVSKICASGHFYADCTKLARKYFKKTNAVITPKGIFATYDSGILAPHERGAVNIFLFRT